MPPLSLLPPTLLILPPLSVQLRGSWRHAQEVLWVRLTDWSHCHYRFKMLRLEGRPSGRVCLLSLVGKKHNISLARESADIFTHTTRNARAWKCTKCSNSLCTDMQFKMCNLLENTFCASHLNPPPAAILMGFLNHSVYFCIAMKKRIPNQSRSVAYVTVVHRSISTLHIRP